ncbi:DUF1294 domain-containing protein [Aneurinibacillus sp. BA2021]|nr:DUF1294 domain-containing protein [Aneurinibacillus sp. BA2021]
MGGYVLAVNLCGWLCMRIDKQRARRHAWRIKEKTLFMIALLGGSLGCLLGMYMFHHKTRHAAFVWGMPAILLIQAVLVMLYGGRVFS